MSNERIEDVLLALEHASGGLAEVWEYTASLSQLTLRVLWPGSDQNIHIVCNGCTRLEMHSVWKIAKLSVDHTEVGLVVGDEAGKFLVECQSVRVFQNVEPRYRQMEKD